MENRRIDGFAFTLSIFVVTPAVAEGFNCREYFSMDSNNRSRSG
jgi:hypothetical protein